MTTFDEEAAILASFKIAGISSNYCGKALEIEAFENTSLHYSYNATDNIQFAIVGLGISFLTFVGIPLNVLSLIVLLDKTMKSSLTTLLLGLTISDIFVIGIHFLFTSLHKVLNRFGVFPLYFTHAVMRFLPWYLPAVHVAQTCSIYITLVITLERYIAVCHPLKARSLCTRSAARRSLLIVTLFSILFNLPKWFAVGSTPIRNCENKTFVYYFSYNDFGNTDIFGFYTRWYIYIFFRFLPFTSLVFFNLAIYRKVRQHHSQKSAPNSTRRTEKSEDIQLAGMLLGIVITYLLCYVMDMVMTLLRDTEIPKHHYSAMVWLSTFLKVFNHSSNFIFYCAFSTRFRKCLKKTLGIRESDNSACQMNCMRRTRTVPTILAALSCSSRRRVNQQHPSSNDHDSSSSRRANENDKRNDTTTSKMTDSIGVENEEGNTNLTDDKLTVQTIV